VFSAGTAQRYLKVDGFLVGKRVDILGSGDIGLIMARRMMLEGAQVLACLEIQPYSSGLNRNIAQCIEDFSIPLYYRHTVTKVSGHARVEAITVAQVDEKSIPIVGTEFEIECDTLLLSVGLIPENELSRQAGVQIDPRTRGPLLDDRRETTVPGIFACGNVAHIHDIVDFVSQEGVLAGTAAAQNVEPGESYAPLLPGDGISYVLPQRVHVNPPREVEVFFRVQRKVAQVSFVATQGTIEILRQSKPYATPGEMERIELPVSGSDAPIRITMEEKQ
jgi:pyruvate/2-oxoglutarate dehydrogenase complex dihydrolipoamide dehydrogenase (E3) component